MGRERSVLVVAPVSGLAAFTKVRHVDGKQPYDPKRLGWVYFAIGNNTRDSKNGAIIKTAGVSLW
jgi:hypothetical protein